MEHYFEVRVKLNGRDPAANYIVAVSDGDLTQHKQTADATNQRGNNEPPAIAAKRLAEQICVADCTERFNQTAKANPDLKSLLATTLKRTGNPVLGAHGFAKTKLWLLWTWIEGQPGPWM